MKRTYVIIGVAAVVTLAAVLAAPLFLPKSGQTLDEGLPPSANGAETEGTPPAAANTTPEGNPLTGRAGHNAAGTVRLIDVDGAYFLRFEDVEQTQGPDVYLYLTKDADAWGRADYDSAVKIRVPQDGDGQFTPRGNFNVPIPAHIDVAEYRGVLTWCDRFAVPFSSAAL